MARWVPLDESVAVNGLTLAGGIYVGDQLEAVGPMRGTEPALVNPLLPVNLSPPDWGGQQMGYWPSYSNIPPASRGAYLRWLEAGRRSGAYIGYVFLFFYGIERRVIVDAATSEPARDEVAALLNEVERLLDLYGHNGSFRGYATDLLATARLAGVPKRVSDLTPPRERIGWDIPLEVKLALGGLAADNEPIPGEWALAWALTSPEIPLRTPATRCPDEFAELFLARYTATYGEGLQIKPTKTKLHLEYRPASASFGGPIKIDSGGLPDVTRAGATTKKLASLVAAVTDELDAYSRYIGRHDDRESARAVGLLPAELARERVPASLAALLADLPAEGHLVVAADDVAAVLDGPATSKLPKRDATALALLLAAQDVGLEPDMRLGTANFSHHNFVVLWRDEEVSAPVGDGFAAATVLMHLGVTVSASDGEVSAVEEQQLESGLATAFDLPPAGQRRLRAHLHWLLAERPGIAGVKARIGTVAADQRKLIARYLLAVAGADGFVSPKEVDSLRRLYGLLGLDSESVHHDLHAMASSSPVPILEADPDSGDFALPAEVLLDDRRLAEVMTSTKQVTEVLNAVFVADELDDESSELVINEASSEAGESGMLASLDGAHATLLRRLSAQPIWARAEFDALAAELGLLGAGAIEVINDVAFRLSDGPLLEGDDLIELDGHVLKEMLDA
jgi:tellurite resistance protein